MQNQDEGPRYTDPGHPYSGSDGRYQNQYSTRSRRPADKLFQFPWWAIVIPFCIGMWPVGIAFIIMNKLMKEGKMADLEERARQRTSQFTHTSRTTTGSDGRTVYEAQFRRVDESGTSTSRNADANTPIYGRSVPPQSTVEAAEKQGKKSGAATALTVAGVALLICALIALPDGIFWLPDALAEGGYYWRWLIEDSMPMLIAAAGGIGCLFGAHKLRTGNRLRKKIANIVGDSQYMYIEDIAAAIPCGYDKCRKHLENCIDAGVFGPDAYLDMKRRCLVVKGKAPETTAPKAPAKTQETQAQTAKEAAQTKDRYQKILDELRRVNDAIPDEEMSDKISRLEAVSAKIFEQAKTDPDKLPRMRKFMDYYLPTTLKLLNAYDRMGAQGVSGENIDATMQRVESMMGTIVTAFEKQLDMLFGSEAMDISADITVLENMMKREGLSEDTGELHAESGTATASQDDIKLEL